MEAKNNLTYRTFVFDLDGTLFTIPVDWSSVRIELARTVGFNDDGGPLFLKINEILSERPDQRRMVFSTIDRYEMAALKKARPLNGARDLLLFLAERGRLAVVTMQGILACQTLLKRHRLLKAFQATVTREDSLDRAEQLKIALRRIGGSIQETLFVGDRLNDVVAAKRVGVKVVLLRHGPVDKQAPDYHFETISRLADFLKGLLAD